MARRTVLTSRQRSALFSPSATRGGPAAPLHPERGRPAQHRVPAASPQQAGLRAAVVRAALPGPADGPGRDGSAARRGFHRPPAPPGRETNSPTTRNGPRPGTSILRSCDACTDSGPSRAARRVRSSSDSERKRPRRSRTRSWSAGSSRPAAAREPSCRPRPRSSGSAPTRWSRRNGGSKPASPNGFRPGFGAPSSICSKRRSPPA